MAPSVVGMYELTATSPFRLTRFESPRPTWALMAWLVRASEVADVAWRSSPCARSFDV
jgi:hypothetical protein